MTNNLEIPVQLSNLVTFIKAKFEEAKLAKDPIDKICIENLYYYNCEYTPEKLQQIREIGGSEIYVPLVNIKCRALKAWLTDTFFPDSGDPPFDIEPTPVPQLPEEVEEALKTEFSTQIQDLLQKALQVEQLSNGQFSVSSILPNLRQQFDLMKKEYLSKQEKVAKDLAFREKQRIYDQFVEGGFFEALDEVLLDLSIFPTAILKACVPRPKKQLGPGKQIITNVIPTFNRVSPFDIFPSPNVSDFSDYVIEILHLTPQDLASLKEVEGFDAATIDVILGLYGETGYSLSIANTSERRKLERKGSGISTNTIDVIEFWGSVKGEILKEYVSDVEDDKYYDVTVWICEDMVLKAVINQDPLGNKPYCKASFISVPGSFWGKSLVCILKSLQDGVNALSRAIVNNSALSSGPMIERNVDRIAPSTARTVQPWAIFDSHDMGMSAAPAFRFYQPNVTAAALIQVLGYYMRLADELSGIPPYAHAILTTGGAGRTATGLSMMMESSSRGIREVVKNIDKGIIEVAVRLQYLQNVFNYYGLTEMPDLNIKAKGSTALQARMAQVSKLLQLLQITSNPTDTAIMGLEGRKQLLEGILAGFGVNIPLEGSSELLMQALGATVSQQAPVLKENKQATSAPVAESSNEMRGEQAAAYY